MHLPSPCSDGKSREGHAFGGNFTRAFTLVEILCVTAIISLLIVMLVPRSRHSGYSRIKCVNNLKNVGLAYRIFATDNNDLFPFQVSTNDGGARELTSDVAAQFRALSNELFTTKILICPRDSRRKSETTNWAALSAKDISYYVGLNASETNASSILGGDAGFSVNGKAAHAGLNPVRLTDIVAYPKNFHLDHGDLINAVLADASVQQIHANAFSNLLKRAGTPTNLFLHP